MDVVGTSKDRYQYGDVNEDNKSKNLFEEGRLEYVLGEACADALGPIGLCVNDRGLCVLLDPRHVPRKKGGGSFSFKPLCTSAGSNA